jgi:hypothetical protein
MRWKISKDKIKVYFNPFEPGWSFCSYLEFP